jgi:hypothetical protein
MSMMFPLVETKVCVDMDGQGVRWGGRIPCARRSFITRWLWRPPRDTAGLPSSPNQRCDHMAPITQSILNPQNAVLSTSAYRINDLGAFVDLGDVELLLEEDGRLLVGGFDDARDEDAGRRQSELMELIHSKIKTD